MFVCGLHFFYLLANLTNKIGYACHALAVQFIVYLTINAVMHIKYKCNLAILMITSILAFVINCLIWTFSEIFFLIYITFSSKKLARLISIISSGVKMGSDHKKTFIPFCVFAVLFSALFLCGCVILSATPVELHVKITNNTTDTIAIASDAELVKLSTGKTMEKIHWQYMAIITSEGYSKEIDLFHNLPNDILKEKCFHCFQLKETITYSFDVEEDGISYRTRNGEKLYKTHQPINYDEILFVRGDAEENDFINLKIKNKSATPIKLTSISPLDPSGNPSSDFLILNDIFQPTVLSPEAEYVMIIPARKILSDIINFKIETNCLQQPALQCKIVKPTSPSGPNHHP